MKISDVVDEGLGHSSYLIDVGDGTVAIIDPPRFPSAHEALAGEKGLRIAWTVDTHSHADYVTGSPALAARTGATFMAPAASCLETPHHPIADGDSVDLGCGLRLVALATPGHTPDHHTYLLEYNGNAMALFTGGSLMVGTVGRTDLCGPELAEPLAHEMFRSLQRFANLPDALAVYPTHGAGSFCSAPGTADRTSTLGSERRTNPMFSLADEDEFVANLLEGFGTFPSYFRRLPELNRVGPRSYDSLPELARLDVKTVEKHVAEGALIVDARPLADFGTGAVPGSVSNALRPVFGSWLGWLVEPEQPLIFVLNDDQDRAELVRQCLDIGHENLLGELSDGIAAWLSADRTTTQIPVVDDIDLTKGSVIDVRQRVEYRSGHIPGAQNIELGVVVQDFRCNGATTVMCGHGERAMTAASLLTANDCSNVSVFNGGPDTWSEATGNRLQTGP